MTAVRLGVLSDVHVTLDPAARERWHHELDLQGAGRRLTEALEGLRARHVDVVVVSGDLTHFGDAASLEAVVAALAAGPAPAVVVPGNHDVLVDGTALAAAVDRVGRGRVRLAAVGGEELAPGIRLAGRDATPVDGLAAPLDVASWGDDLVVWLAHFPVVAMSPGCAGAGLADAGDALDVAEATAALVARPAPTIAVTGHFHVRHAATYGSLLQLGSAALVEPPGDVGVLAIERAADTVVRWEWWSRDTSGGLRLPVLAASAGSAVLDADGRWRERPGDGAPLPAVRRGDGLAAAAFDWNGTLVDDRDDAWRATAAVMARRGRPELTREEFAATFRLPLTALFADLGADDPAVAADEWNAHLLHTVPVPMAGAREALAGLRAAGVVLGVVSAAAQDVVTAQVVACGLADVVDFVVAGPAPKREPLTRLGRLAPGRVAYLGDTEYDVQEALAAGVRALGWAHGYRPASALLAAGAERVLTSMAELAELAGGRPRSRDPAVG